MFSHKRVITAVFIMHLAVGNVAAGNLSLSDAPLSVSTSAEPNIMLLIDNSGSMDTIIESDYFLANPPADNQTEWRPLEYYSSGGYYYYGSVYSNNEGNFYPLRGVRHNCSTGFLKFYTADASQSKCLRLPDPVGGENTRYTGAYINYLLNTYSSGTDLRGGSTIPDDYRMNVARNVASNLIPDFDNVRFGLSSFYGPSSYSYGHGATINRNCGSSVADIQTSLNGLSASTNTPLAEALYEVTRYFRGLSSYYHSNTTYTSPIQYRCQKNFTIAITDGFPTYDRNYPTNDPADVLNTGKSLPDWDGEHPNTNSSQYPSFPQYSDGFDTSGNSEGATLYLDDIALFANEIDMKTFDVNGNDLDGISWDDTTDNAKFAQQNMLTYTIGFATENQMLEDAAAYGQGGYENANNADELTTKLKAAINDILARAGAASSAAASTGSLQVGTLIYQASFNSGDWVGSLVTYEFDTDTTSGTYGELLTELDTDVASDTYGEQMPAEVWDAADLIPAWDIRNIITNIGSTGTGFNRDYFDGDAANSAATNASIAGLLADNFDDDLNLVDYLRGRAVTAYRARTSLLGDIVHSSPIYVGAPNRNYTDTFESGSETYAQFAARLKDRTPVIYVGANDGMLHAFDAADGDELMAYIPGILLPDLKNLSVINYSHQYYVDGTPTIQDAFIDTGSSAEWRTVLVSGLNKGGQSIFALDVTDPEGVSDNTVSFSEDNADNVFLWEFTDADDAELGYSYSQPVIAKLNDNKWYAIFGSGYNNTEADGHASLTGDASVFIVDLENGSLVKNITTATGMDEDPTSQNRPNGLPRVTLVDTNNDSKTDYLYAGDLFGNLWKFDLSGSTIASWGLAYKAYTACSDELCTEHQPITTKVSVNKHSSDVGIMVYFGTGKYIETTDNNGAAGGVQSIYGIWDKGSVVSNASGRSQLQQQSIIYEDGVTFTDTKGTLATNDDTTTTETIRVISNNALSTTDKGWYMDLIPPSGVEAGERQVTELLLRRDRLIFSSSIPIDSVCNPSGDSWLFDLKAETGSRLSYSAFDLNEDGAYGKDDMVTVTIGGEEVLVPITAIKTGTGASKITPLLDDENGCTTKYIQGGSQKVINSFCGPGYGRQKWQQIFR
ncbi:pilus assembly protein [Neptunomonas antarctica]|uniref:Type IV pilus assembly protein PilY1 n=1 Tax=Neptunomonas antarctica TaxID=619304 RepID=A0A1N7MGB4_9GAMM|nr:PilC/PilY family type IV pilus protein [Neptunomonas antarctica]SIS85174.1 type IV pilus assembly protein PilY1 [Neptunomonas antarctica]